jgi:hypothetical protein
MKQSEFDNLVERLLNEALDEKVSELKSKLEVTEKNKHSKRSNSVNKKNDSDRLMDQIMEIIQDELGEEDMNEGNAFSEARCKAGCKGGNGAKIQGFDGKVVKGWSDDDKESCGCKELKESKKIKMTLSENELIDLIEKLVNEEKAKGLQVYNKVHNEDGKENEQALKDVAKKMEKYVKDGSNEKYNSEPTHFPKGNGELKKMSKKAYTPSDAVEEYIEAFAYPGQTNLRFDEIKPNDELIEKYLEGDSTTGNAQVDKDGKPLGNVTPDEVGKKFKKNYDENLFGIEQAEGSYKRVTQPVDQAGEGTTKGKLRKKGDKILNTLESVEEKKKSKLNEELSKIQKITNYNQRTQ